MYREFLASLFVLFAFVACANVSPLERRQHADAMAAEYGWERLRLVAGDFVLAAYVPKSVSRSDVLTIYIEGDGLAWLSGTRASDDPTPRNPTGLELALRHSRGAAAYLARPCQFVEGADAGNCRKLYWTGGRFAPEVIEASDQAISILKQSFGAKKLVLIGYSGGGAVSALVAARRNDVVRLVTVAGNLDHQAWTEQHQILPLSESLNPADEWMRLTDVPQLHFVGEHDGVIGREIADSFVSRFPMGRQPGVVLVPDFDHVCCWIEKWDKLLLEQLDIGN